MKIYKFTIVIVLAMMLSACIGTLAGGSKSMDNRGEINITILIIDGIFVLTGFGLLFLLVDAITGGLYHEKLEQKTEN